MAFEWQKRFQCPNFSRSQSYHGVQERPPLNPEKETETPGFFFEILILREFLRNPSILPFHSDWNVFNPHGAPSKISPLHSPRTSQWGYERDNKVLVRSHSGTRGWFQPWPFTGAFTTCNYPACPRKTGSRRSTTSVFSFHPCSRTKNNTVGTLSTRVRNFFFLFVKLLKEIFLFSLTQGRENEHSLKTNQSWFFPTIKSWIIGSIE